MCSWVQALAGLVVLVLAWTADAATPSAPLRVFLDCVACDTEFLRQQMRYLDWVRDRRDADLYVLATTRVTGAGGTETQLFVTRMRGGGPSADTLRLHVEPGASEDDARQVLLRGLQAIVARDLVDRPEFDRMRLVVERAATVAPTRDPWHAWVFSLSANGYVDGQQSARNTHLSADVSASRTTEGGKIALTSYGNYDESRFTFDDGSRYTSIRHGHGGRLRAAVSMTPRWSAGALGFYTSSTFSNIHLEAGGGPALEFDAWPYHESSRRLFTIAYQATGRWVEYEEITLFGRTSERLWRHGVTARLSGTQPWGSVGLTGDAGQYLELTDQYRLTATGNVSLNLARGFSLNLSGYAARVRDLRSLPRSGATDEEVIARQRLIGTSYEYFASAGLSFTFGSIHQGVVNPRLNAVFGRF